MAEYSDGSIVVDTEIDTEGFLKDSKKLNQALTSLSGQFSRIGQQMKTAIAKNNTAALETLNRKWRLQRCFELAQGHDHRGQYNRFSYGPAIRQQDRHQFKFQRL